MFFVCMHEGFSGAWDQVEPASYVCMLARARVTTVVTRARYDYRYD